MFAIFKNNNYHILYHQSITLYYNLKCSVVEQSPVPNLGIKNYKIGLRRPNNNKLFLCNV